MGVLCAVFNCGNNASRDKDKGFFRIPKIIYNNDPEKREENLSWARRKQWLKNISRKDLSEEKAASSRVCSDHFISGKFILLDSCLMVNKSPKLKLKVVVSLLGKPSSLWDRSNADWAPTQKMGHNKITKPKASDLSRAQRSQERAAKKVKMMR